MSITQFPETQYFFLADSSPAITNLGSFQLTENTELAHIMIWIQKVGEHAGNESFQLVVSGDDTFDNLLFESDAVAITDFENITSTHWYGYVLFDLSRENLTTGIDYHIGIKPTNYSKADDNSFYIAVAADWPEPINNYAVTNKTGAAISLLGYQ
jgi:hypothetical protein